jgi:hypothetical protein
MLRTDSSRRRLEAGATALALCVPLALSWAGGNSDVRLYHAWATRLLEGGLPYRDVPIEYPPLAVLLFWLPGLVARAFPAYLAAFMLLMAAFDGLQRAVLWGSLSRRRLLFAALFALLAAPLYYTYYKRFDVAAAACTSLALGALVRRPASLGAWAWLALGASIKLYPMVLAPLALCYSHHRGVPWRRLSGQVACALALGIALLGACYAIAGDASLAWLAYHRDRGLHLASTYASGGIAWQGLGVPVPTELRFGANQVMTPWAAWWARWAGGFTAAAVAVTLGAYARHVTAPAALWRGAAALVLALMVFSKVLSPQYFVWLVPVACMACVTTRSFDYLLAGLMVLAGVLTAQTFPGEGRIYEGDVAKQLALLARNGLLVWMWLFLLRYPQWLGVRMRRRRLTGALAAA